MCQVSRLHDPNRASYTRTTVTSSFMGRFSSNSLVPLSGRVVSHVPSFKAPRSKLSELYTKNCNFVIYGPIQLKFAGFPKRAGSEPCAKFQGSPIQTEGVIPEKTVTSSFMGRFSSNSLVPL